MAVHKSVHLGRLVHERGALQQLLLLWPERIHNNQLVAKVNDGGGNSYNQSGGEDGETSSSEGDIFIWDDGEMVWCWSKARQHNNQPCKLNQEAFE
jgi:hypothetical protein